MWMDVRFYVDPEADVPYVYGHRASEVEAVEVPASHLFGLG